MYLRWISLVRSSCITLIPTNQFHEYMWPTTHIVGLMFRNVKKEIYIHRRRQNTEWSCNIALRLIRRRAHSNQNWRFFPNYKAHNMSLTRTFFHAYNNTLFPIQCQHFPENSCTSCCCLKPRAIWILAGGVVTKLSLNLLRHLLKGMLFQRQC